MKIYCTLCQPKRVINERMSAHCAKYHPGQPIVTAMQMYETFKPIDSSVIKKERSVS